MTQLKLFPGIDPDGQDGEFWNHRVRLACVNCDTEEGDGLFRIPKDWHDVHQVQSIHDATLCPPIECERYWSQEGSSDWWTHLGWCPECFAEME